MLNLYLILVGALLATLGLGWAGMAVSRAAWVAVWSFGAVAAVLGGIAASMGAWGVTTDLAFGFYGFFFAAAGGLSTAAYATAASGGFNILALGMLVAAVTGVLVFVAAALAPGARGLRSVSGWLLVFAGLSVAFLGYAPLIHVQF